MDTAKARYGTAQAAAANGAATPAAAAGKMATIAARAIPTHMRAATRTPATALETGENGLTVPKASIDTGAAAASAANPVAKAPENGGGSHRRRPNSMGGPRTAMPATARYDSLNDSEWAPAGLAATAAQNTTAKVASAG